MPNSTAALPEFARTLQNVREKTLVTGGSVRQKDETGERYWRARSAAVLSSDTIEEWEENAAADLTFARSLVQL